MTNHKKNEDPFISAIDILMDRKSVIIIGFLSVMAISVIAIWILPPRFEARAKLQIEPPALPRLEAPYLNEIGSRSFFDNQKEIVMSRSILEPVVNKPQLHLLPDTDGFVQRLRNTFKDFMNLLRPGGDSMDRAISDLETKIDAYYIRGTSMLVIEANSSSSEGAARIANTVAETFVDHVNSLLQSKTKVAYHYIEDLVKQAEERVNHSWSELNKFKKQNNILLMNEELSIVLKQISELDAQIKGTDTQITILENDLNILKSAETEARREIAATGKRSDKIVNEDILRLISEIEKLKTDLSLAEISLKENHPDIKELKSKISLLEKRLDQERSKQTIGSVPTSGNAPGNYLGESQIQIKRNEINRNRSMRENLVDQKGKILRQRDSLVGMQSKIEQLNRDYETDLKSYQLVRDKLEQAKILQPNDRKEGQIKIIEKAYPPASSVKRKTVIVICVSVIISLIFGVGMAFTLEYFDDTFKSPDDVESSLGIQVLGVLPNISKKSLKL
jgi:uncharacterized protein involved in exopolysaccharide biosynthesis